MLPSEDTVADKSSRAVSQSMNGPMVPLSGPTSTFPILETITKAALSPEVFPMPHAAVLAISNGDEYWYPQLVDRKGLCVYGSSYTMLYRMDSRSR